MDTARVARCAAARRLGRTLAEMVCEEAATLPADAQSAFWEELRSGCPAPPVVVMPATSPAPMTDSESREFGNTCPFRGGAYAGIRIDEIPRGYLRAVANNQDDLRSQLARYLASERIRAEEDHDHDDSDDG